MAEDNTEEQQTQAQPQTQTQETGTTEQPEKRTTPRERSPQELAALRTLMSREKALKKKEQDLKAAQKDLEEYRSLRDTASKDPIKAMQALGISYEEAAKRAAAGDKVDPMEPLKKDIEELKTLVQDSQRREEELRTKALWDEAANQVEEYVSSSDKYPYTKAAPNGGRLVFEAIRAHYRQTGELLSEDEAASDVEKQIESVVESALKNEEIRKRHLQNQASPSNSPAPGLSSRLSSEVTSRRGQDDILSDEESLMEVAKLIRTQDKTF